MKHTLLPAFLLLLAGCPGTTATHNACQAQIPDDALGQKRMLVYRSMSAGSVPSVLVLYGYEYSGDAVFTLSEADTASSLNLKCFQGRVYTLRGENDATVWQCKSSEGRVLYFLTEVGNDTIYRVPDDVRYTRDVPYCIMK